VVFIDNGWKLTCDTAQLGIFVQGIGNEFAIVEELIGVMAVKGTAASEDLHAARCK
jgi:hypothetical protein